MEIVIVIAMAVIFLSGSIGIASALIKGIDLYANGQRTLSNVILVVSVLGIFGTVALFIALATLL